MKRYVSHKEVEAGKIKELHIGKDISKSGEVTSVFIHLENEDASKEVSPDWYNKHSDNGQKDLSGGYFITYEDGYKSWSPAEAFEKGYTLIN